MNRTIYVAGGRTARTRWATTASTMRFLNSAEVIITDYDETLKDIQKTMGLVPGFMKALPKEVLVHDYALWKKYTMDETEIPGKYRELMGLAVAANIKCPYCIAMHTAMAKYHGATDEELREIYYLSSLTSRWSAMIHAQQYDMDKFAKEGEQMSKYLAESAKK